MDRDLAYDYLLRSGMDAAQADVLSRILADMEARLATKADLAALQAELKADFAGLRAEWKEEFTGLRAELRQDLGGLQAEWKEEFTGLRAEWKEDSIGLRGELKLDVAALESKLTWRFVAMFVAMSGFLALVMTLLTVFVR